MRFLLVGAETEIQASRVGKQAEDVAIIVCCEIVCYTVMYSILPGSLLFL